jgi:hypothetical protein
LTFLFRRHLLKVMRVLMFILAGSLLVAGCQTTGDKKSRGLPAFKKGKSKVEMTPDYALRGRVAMVNLKTRSVILSFPIGWIPAVERRLNVYRAGAKVGEVKITGPQIDTNVAGDLIAGEAKVGDEVREN